ncbi:ABCC4.2 family protein [Megaselia abdita]
MQSVKSEQLRDNPRKGTNILSILCFCYTVPLFFKGRKKDLETEDLYKPLKEHTSDRLGNKLCKSWEDELEKASKKNKEPSLLKATLRVFGWKIFFQGVMVFFIEFAFRCSQPIFLGGLVNFYSQNKHLGDDMTEAYLYAGGLLLCIVMNVLCTHSYMFGNIHLGMKIRVAMCSMVYRKSLKLSKTALGDTTSGQVVNLISNDVGRLDLIMLFVHYLWLGPTETIVVTYLLWREIGYASLFGVVFMLCFIPLQGYLGKKTSVLRLRTALRTDERVRLMNEIVQGIQVIKMYAWEFPFAKMVEFARRKEINAIRYVSYIRGILLSFILFLTRVSIFISLVGFVLLGSSLTAKQAFVVTAYYNILRITMTVQFPQSIAQLAETLVSFKRIQKFMSYEETKIVSSESDNQIPNDSNQSTTEKDNIDLDNFHKPHSNPGITITDLKAKWVESSTDYTLDNVNFDIKPRTLVAIIGPVGAGKSSVIQSILGELPATSGSVDVKGSVSYASQEPWLFTGTVRQNILFGLPYDKRRYKMVVKKCALERDFDLLPYGDKTIVGERGASLSGGQKARISLARSVYRQADIYLLDDPLSAVDTHVGKHLFEQCMRGYLRDKIVLLVTHQLQFLQQADQIVILDKGKVSASGSYESLRQSGLDFAKMLSDPEEEKEVENEKRRLSSASSKKSIQRQNSEASLNSTTESILEDAPNQVKETQQVGSIGLGLYKRYFTAGGGPFFLFITGLSIIVAQVLASGGDYFLSYWVNSNESPIQSQIQPIPGIMMDSLISNDTAPAHESIMGSFLNIFRDANNPDKNNIDIYIFTAITVLTVAVTLSRSFLFFSVAMKSSTTLHNSMFKGITHASMYFFNTNPTGRILNRFSKDMGQVDEILPAVMMDVAQIFLALFGIVVVVAMVNPLFLIPTFILAVIFYFLRAFYLKTSRDVKRIEGVTRSPIYSHLGASLNGLATIRSFNAQNILIKEFDNYQDGHSSAYFMFISTSRAFGFWLDCFCVIYIAIITLSFFIMPAENGGNVGLAITQAMGMTGMVQWGMRQSAELENTMTSVERVVEYDSIDPEGDLDSTPDKKPPKEWPEDGLVKFDHLSLRYFPDPKSEKVLKNLTFTILPKEKVGIVGRTGAGKSSLINALFRLSYNEGSIVIDSRDTGDIGLHDLRSKISIIPQEPVLFSGTMRYNLDPFDEYSDEKLWNSLEEVKLKQVIKDLPFGLQSKISEGGSNFSVGQRQLVCLARAILRENKVLVLDEATANVDPQTDALIQQTIRNKFAECTVMTIAHRLNTVMDSDKVLVMDAGQVVEFGSPYELLTKSEKKVFHGMVQQTGKAMFESLLKVAEKAHVQNNGMISEKL